MNTFSKEDFKNYNYIYSIGLLNFIKNNKPIEIKDNIDIHISTNNYIKTFENAIYDTKTLPIGFFTTKENIKFSFTDIIKKDSIKTQKINSNNILGRKLSNACELATIESIKKKIKRPEDTQQDIFKNDIELFLKWKKTFDYTKIKVQEICKNILQYDIIHDATDKTGFSNIIEKTASKLGISKDAYNPADIYLVKKNKRKEILKKLNEVYDTTKSNTKILLQSMNQCIYNLYLDNLFYPISLKQLKDAGKIEYSNIPTQKLPEYNISYIHCNTSWSTGKEIGVITFVTKNNIKINTQVRGFPHGYRISQLEITSDGSNSGGKIGKVPTNIIDNIMSKYNYSRIKSISYFGNKKAVNGTSYFLSNITDKEIKFWYDTYISVCKKIQGNHENINFKDFSNLINEAKTDLNKASNIVIKIQGLNFLNFYIKNINNINEIVSKIIYGAKKMSNDNSFFIKIY